MTSLRLARAAFFAALCAFPNVASEQAIDTPSKLATIARGKYVAEGVAVCWKCHTPRDRRGLPDQGHWLMGGPIPFEPVAPTDDWAAIAPRLAGLPPGTDEQFVTLLMTGISRTGKPPRRPMPQFRMTRTDAEAVLAYLKSIKTAE